MKRRCLHLFALACLVQVQPLRLLAQEDKPAESAKDIEAQLKKAVLENIKSTEAEDVEATMKTIHSRSPLYQASRKQLSQIFGKHLGIKYELVSLKYLARDGEYVIARVLQRTTQSPPVNIKNNESDMIVAFRKEGQTWKFWNQAPLEYRYLKP
jgi:hypothetical protein